MARRAEWGDSVKVVLREYAESLIIAVLLALVVRGYVVSAYQVPSLSMNPTLIEGDFILGYKLPFGVKLPFSSSKIGEAPPIRGETVIFSCPEVPKVSCIKRVVGLPGDRIEIQGKRLIVNGQMATYRKTAEQEQDLVTLQESFGQATRQILITSAKERENFGPVIVPPGHFFALGDHRDVGRDSRHWGPISFDKLEARAVLIWLSFDWGHPGSESGLPKVRWSRLFRSVD